MIRRRDFITLLGGAAAGWPLAASAQQATPPRRLGVLYDLGANDPEEQRAHGVFLHELQQLGWQDGRNVVIDVRYSGGDAEQMRVYSKELVTLKPERDKQAAIERASAHAELDRNGVSMGHIQIDAARHLFELAAQERAKGETAQRDVAKLLTAASEIAHDVSPYLYATHQSIRHSGDEDAPPIRLESLSDHQLEMLIKRLRNDHILRPRRVPRRCAGMPLGDRKRQKGRL